MRRLQHLATLAGLMGLLVAPLSAQTPSPTDTPATDTPAATSTSASPSVTPSTESATPAAEPTSPAPATPSEPTAPPTPKARAIWDYQKELGLSNDQVAKIKKTVRDLQDKADAAQGRYNGAKDRFKAAQQAYASLVEKDGDLEQIRVRMREMADIEREMADMQINMQIENLKAKRILRKVITPAQMQKWQEIQKTAPGP